MSDDDDYREIINKVRGKKEREPSNIPTKDSFEWFPFGGAPNIAFLVIMTIAWQRGAWPVIGAFAILWVIWVIGWNYIVKPRL